jgi:hypothetical protein
MCLPVLVVAVVLLLHHLISSDTKKTRQLKENYKSKTALAC